MKNLSLYHIPIFYLIVYSIAILVSGVWMFLLSQGLATSDIFSVLQNIIESPSIKSVHTMIEVATPHIFAIGTLLFIISHFLLFSTKISYKTSMKVSLLLFIVALGNILAYLPLTLGFFVSAWIKLLFLGLFILLFVVLLGMVLFSL